MHGTSTALLFLHVLADSITAQVLVVISLLLEMNAWLVAGEMNAHARPLEVICRRCEVSVLLSSLLCLRGMQFLICHMSHMESGPLPCLCRGSCWRSGSSAPRAGGFPARGLCRISRHYLLPYSVGRPPRVLGVWRRISHVRNGVRLG
jgi:hypothetical protein